jgi:hypothetical protein
LRALRHPRERRAQRRLADELLLAGAAAYPDSLLGGRAHELTSERERRMLARSLERTVRELEGRVLPSAVPLNRAGALARRLRADEPVTARGVLLVQEFLGDGHGSPLYNRERVPDVRPALEECLAALEPSERRTH